MKTQTKKRLRRSWRYLFVPAIFVSLITGFILYFLGTLVRCLAYLFLLQPRNAQLQLLNYWIDLKNVKW